MQADKFMRKTTAANLIKNYSRLGAYDYMCVKTQVISMFPKLEMAFM